MANGPLEAVAGFICAFFEKLPIYYLHDLRESWSANSILETFS